MYDEGRQHASESTCLPTEEACITSSISSPLTSISKDSLLADYLLLRRSVCHMDQIPEQIALRWRSIRLIAYHAKEEIRMIGRFLLSHVILSCGLALDDDPPWKTGCRKDAGTGGKAGTLSSCDSQ